MRLQVAQVDELIARSSAAVAAFKAERAASLVEDVSPGLGEAADQAIEPLTALDSRAGARYDEILEIFQEVWNTLSPIVSEADVALSWRSTAESVECVFSGRGTTSITIRRVGLQACVEVRSPLAIHSHVAVFPLLSTDVFPGAGPGSGTGIVAILRNRLWRRATAQQISAAQWLCAHYYHFISVIMQSVLLTLPKPIH